jgi:hypothetical protein
MFNKRKSGRLLKNAGGFTESIAFKNASLGETKAMIIGRNNNVDEGIIAYGLWLKAADKRSLTLPMMMKEFQEDKRVVLQDNILRKGITVEIVEGIPFCNQCRSNDCIHVGFAVCAEQMKET